MSEDEPKSPKRRDFLNIAVGGSAAAFSVAMGYPAVRFIQPRARANASAVNVGPLDAFPIGGAKTVLVNERPVIVIRSADGQLRAFSAICTHLQCIVGFSAERNQFECPCHQGAYAADGQVIAGPPPRKLEELVVTLNEGSVILSAVG